MSSTDMITMTSLGVGLVVTILLLFWYMNPLIILGNQLIRYGHVYLGPVVNVLERDNDKLIVIEPDDTVLLNTAGILYYYFEGGASQRMCPSNEYAVVRMARRDIVLINENNSYNIACTPTSALALKRHFESAILSKLSFPIPWDASYTVIDVINMLIDNGVIGIYS
ncbi:ORF_75 [Adoxophyes orana granulovirus]|uniref:ORF_75 n=1 Tax=Adoxophyes orana granulovirus TaxID=170617 RepID=Q7T9U0_GVAO|nr:ORF_75 [Adoxophyes orana granulovirus]AAP85712.1 ORF_75 [Adoxophyes orana granulovirus]AJA91715.1 per os infectivity factor 4 [Adoxophyes orana granulovirus]